MYWAMGVATFILVGGFILIQVMPTTLIGIFNKDSQLMQTTLEGIKVYLFLASGSFQMH